MALEQDGKAQSLIGCHKPNANESCTWLCTRLCTLCISNPSILAQTLPRRQLQQELRTGRFQTRRYEQGNKSKAHEDRRAACEHPRRRSNSAGTPPETKRRNTNEITNTKPNTERNRSMKILFRSMKLAVLTATLAVGSLSLTAVATPAADAATTTPILSALGQGGGAQVYGWRFTAGVTVRLEILDAKLQHVEAVQYIKPWLNSTRAYGTFETLMPTNYTGSVWVV